MNSFLGKIVLTFEANKKVAEYPRFDEGFFIETGPNDSVVCTKMVYVNAHTAEQAVNIMHQHYVGKFADSIVVSVSPNRVIYDTESAPLTNPEE